MSFFMSRYSDSTYALMRFITGLLFLWHGCQNLFDFPKAASEMPEFIQYGAAW